MKSSTALTAISTLGLAALAIRSRRAIARHDRFIVSLLTACSIELENARKGAIAYHAELACLRIDVEDMRADVADLADHAEACYDACLTQNAQNEASASEKPSPISPKSSKKKGN
jgi:hypothetical protein